MAEDGQPQWKLERPGERAEEMFQDDPVMLAMVQKARAEPDPVQKPWWWIALMLLTGLLVAAADAAVMRFVFGWGWVPHPLVPLAGLTGGCAVFIGVVGFRPGAYKVTETDERLTLWKPTSGALRAAFLAGGLAFAALGPALVLLDASQKPAHHQPAPKGHR